MALPSLTLRNTKGSALTYTELDNNFTNLSTATTNVTVGSTTTTLALNDTLTLAAGSNITLTANSTSKTITIASTASGGLTEIKTDTTPRLGGDLDVQTFSIVTTVSNRAINLTPNGTGDVNLNADTVRIGDANAAATLTTNGTGDLVLNTNAGTNSGNITITQGANADISITPNGTGNLNVVADTMIVGDAGVQALIASNGSANLQLATNSGSSGATITLGAGANGALTLAVPVGGNVIIDANTWPQTDGTAGQMLITDGSGILKWVSTGSFTTLTANSGAFTSITASTITASTSTAGATLALTYTPSTASGSAITATGKDTQGGTGYFDFLKVTNTTAGATNANKTFRTNSTGQLEIINSAYTSVILALTDAGALQVGGTTFPTATGSNGQVLTANGSGGSSWTTPAAAVANGVQSISFGSTGLTPATATTGTVTVGGCLTVANGGTNTTEIPVNGQILIAGNSSYLPRFLTAGTNITITTGTNSITIASSAGVPTVYQAGSLSTTYTPNANSGTIHFFTLTNSITINTVSNLTLGDTFQMVISQDSTGNRVVTWPSTFLFEGGVSTLSTSTNAVDVVDALYTAKGYYCSIRKAFVGTGTTDPYWSNVTLLLSMDGTNGTTSTWTDSSNLAASVTVTPSSTVFPSHSSSVFKFSESMNLSTQSHTVSGSTPNKGSLTVPTSTGTGGGLIDISGSWTIEGWIYFPTSLPTSSDIYFLTTDSPNDWTYSASMNGVRLGKRTNNEFAWYMDNGTDIGGPPSAGSASNQKFTAANTWYHIALVKNGTTITPYLNGVASLSYDVGSRTNNQAFAYARIGNDAQGYSSALYMDEIRITKGVARYTGNFTPPTTTFPRS